MRRVQCPPVLISPCPQESGDDEYQGDQSDTEDEVDSDFDIDEGDEPSSDGEAEEPRRKRRVVTKAYKVQRNLCVCVWGGVGLGRVVLFFVFCCATLSGLRLKDVCLPLHPCAGIKVVLFGLP